VDSAAPVLLDVTRLVALGWTGRHPTGIDRVCRAYLRHFRYRAQAVVQHRGVIRVLEPAPSAALFDVLEHPAPGMRRRIARQLSAALIARPARERIAGRAYLNIGHTDFDLPVHHGWAREHRLRPFYFLHDLIPVVHPEYSRPHAVRRHLGRVESALAGAEGIILGSQAVADELAAFAAARGLPLPPHAVAHLAGEIPLPAALPPPAYDRPFFLCVATIEPRKNHRLLLDLWARLAARLGDNTPRLVLVGQIGPLTGDILAPLAANPTLQAHVTHHAACCDAELARLMHHARALLMPTLAEGFGLPFVEALAAGTPVIASDLPVLREIGQGAARLIDPACLDGWERAVLAALEQPALRAKDFVPQRWGGHFEVVERFIADPAQFRRPSSERVLAA